MPSTNAALCYVCDDCKKTIDLEQPINLCPHCGGLLEVQYDIKKIKSASHLFKNSVRDSIWRYRDLFPPVKDSSIVSLGEGGTPLVRSKYLGEKLGLKNLYFKNDTLMPTGSFKDRGFSLAISHAVSLGVKKGLTYSSGNAGASFAAYCARSGFSGLVLVEFQASPTKKSMILLYGSNSIILNFENFEQISRMLDEAVSRLGCFLFVNFINPVRHEAMKTYAYEIYTELGFVPDYSVHPVGTGGGLWGTWKGYKELHEAGVIDKLPKMVGVQPEAVCWLKNAVDSGAEIGTLFGDSTKTIAQSISGNSPLHGGRRLIKTVTESRGLAMAVTDEEIIAAMKDLGHEGIAAEPSSAASVASVKKAVLEGKINKTDSIVCVITGTAYKQPSILEKITQASGMAINANIDELQCALKTLSVL